MLVTITNVINILEKNQRKSAMVISHGRFFLTYTNRATFLFIFYTT